jgi:predicted ATPase/class 3 adenylate cyclase
MPNIEDSTGRENQTLPRNKPLAGPGLAGSIPPDLYRFLREEPGENPKNYSLSGIWTVLSADLGGFVALGERLSQQGRIGAERLNYLLNGIFETLIEIVAHRGGSVLSFTGDALQALFPAKLANQACQAGWEMLRAIENHPQPRDYTEETLELSLRVGIGTGQGWGLVVGDPANRLYHIFLGESLKRMELAQRTAGTGELIIDRATLEKIEQPERHYQLIGLEDNLFQLISTEKFSPRQEPTRSFTQEDGAAELVRPFLHKRLYQRLRSGQTPLAEHRWVTTLFGRFTELDYQQSPEQLEELDRYCVAVQRLIERYGGYLNEFDFSEKGARFVAYWGAPIVHDNSATQAVGCALELSELDSGRIHTKSIGLSHGLVYTGEVGSTRRHSYTVMGDAVNLAARLSELGAVGQVLCDQKLYEQTSSNYKYKDSNLFRIRGKRQPVSVYEPGERWRSDLERPVVMVGRDAELQRLTQLAQEASRGIGQTILITGAAGSGKTLLLEELQNTLDPGDYRWLGAGLTEMETQAPLALLANLFSDALSLPRNLPRSKLKDLLTEKVQQLTDDGEIIDRLSFFGAMIFGLEYPDSLYEDTTPEIRAQNLFEIVLLLLRELAKQQPLILILDDLHWADALTMKALSYLTNHLDRLPILCVLVQRPTESDPEVEQLTLAPLQREAIQRLIAHTLGEPGPAERLTDLILQRSQGNPFHARELVRNLRTQDALTTRKGVWVTKLPPDKLDLPGSLEQTITVGLDQLEESTRQVLGTASILSEHFDESSLSRLLPDSSFTSPLSELVKKGILRQDKNETLAFTSALVRRVVYDSTPFQRREELHSRLAELMVGKGNPPSSQLGLIAWHYEKAKQPENACDWYVKAAETARRDYRNTDALEFYERVISLVESQETRVKAQLELVGVLNLLGYWDATEAVLSQMEAEESLTPQQQVELGITRIRHLFALDRYQEARTLAEENLSRARTLKAKTQERNLLTLLGSIMRNLGEIDEALELHQQAVEIAHQQQDRTSIARSLATQGIILGNRGDYHEALSKLEESRSIFRERGDRLMESRVSSLIGTRHFYHGQYDKAVTGYNDYLSYSKVVGDRKGEATILANLAAVHLRRGFPRKALEQYNRSIALCQTLDSKTDEARATGNKGEAHLELGQMLEAEPCFTYYRNVCRENSNAQGELAMLINLARYHLRRGEFEQTLAILDEAETISRRLDNLNDKVIILKLRLRVYLLRKQPDKTGKELEQLAKLTEEHPTHRVDYLLLDALVALLKDDNDRAAAIVEELEKTGLPKNDFLATSESRSKLGRIMLALGRYEKAKELLTRAERVFRQSGTPWQLGKTLRSLAELACLEGQTDLALDLLAEATTLFEGIGATFELEICGNFWKK